MPESTVPAAPPSGQPTGEAVPFDREKTLRTVLIYSVLAGLCPLVPVPFLDDFLVSFLRRFMVRDLFVAHGYTTSNAQRSELRRRRVNRLVGCLKMVVWYPIKKIMGKILYILAIKEAIDVLSEVLHEGLLIHIALERGDLPREGDALLPFTRLRDAMVETMKHQDTQSIDKVIRRVLSDRALVKEIAVSVGKQAVDIDSAEAVEDAIDEIGVDGSEPVGKLVTEMGTALKGEKDYFEHLAEGLAGQLRAWDARQPQD